MEDIGFNMPIISSGNMCKCSFGTIPIPLISVNLTINVEKAPIVINTDTSTLISFGTCSSPANPAVQAAIAASLGTVEVAPCKSAIITPWLNTKNTVLACGKPVCTSSSTCHCMWGGTISITNIKNFTVL